MVTSRSYQDACGMAHALDLVGERWALLVVRELVLGPKRYSDLKSDLPGISTNVLSHRLDELEQAGVVARRRLPRPAGSWVYELTDWGHELEPIIKQLGRWGARSPSHAVDAHLSASSLILSLRTNFDGSTADGLTADYELRLGDERFLARVAQGRLDVVRATAAQVTAAIEAAPGTLAAVIYGGVPLDEAVAAGDVVVEGDTESAERFLTFFTLPVPAR